MRRVVGFAALLVTIAAIVLVLLARGLIGGDAVRRALETQLSARVGEPVRIGSLGASFVPRVTLDLRDVTVGDPPAVTVAEIAIATGLRGLFSRRVEDASVVVSNSRIPTAALGAIAGIRSDGTPSADQDGFTIVSVRRLALRNVEIVAGPRVLVVDLESSLDGDRLDVTSLAARSAGTSLRASGTLTSLAKRTGAFTATADRLNLDELLALALPEPSTDAARPRGKAPESPLDVTVELTAPEGTFAGYAFQQLSTTVHLTPGRVVAQPATFRVFGGTYDGSIHLTSSSTVPDVALAGRIAGIDMPTLLTATGGASSMTGTLGGTISIAGRGTTASDVLQVAQGHGTIAVTDGVIPGLELVRSIVLAFGKPSGVVPGGSGSAFSRLAGTFRLAGQVLRSDDVVLASRDFDLAGRAGIGVPSGALDVHASVVLSRELTLQAGTDLRRYAQENGRVVVPVTIGGTLAEPRVAVDVAGVLNRALQNELKRKVKGLFDRIIKVPNGDPHQSSGGSFDVSDDALTGAGVRRPGCVSFS